MTRAKRKPTDQLAAQRASNSGFAFVASDDSWQLSKDIKLSLTWMAGLLSVELIRSTRLTLAVIAEKYSASDVNRIAGIFCRYVRWVAEERGKFVRISEADLISFRVSLGVDREYRLIGLKKFFKTWCQLGLDGVDESVGALTAEWRLKSNAQGVAVATRCPIHGPLSDIEYEALRVGLTQAYEMGELELEKFVVMMLFAASGRRPRQLGDLKTKDVIRRGLSGGSVDYELAVPRIKQRGVGWRDAFRRFPLDPNLAWLVEELLKYNRRRLEGLIGEVTEVLFLELPIFPIWKDIEDLVNVSTSSMLSTMSTVYFHRKAKWFRATINSVMSKLDVRSDRVEGPIHMYPYRLRRTVGTRAAREGYGPLVIAELLDHSSTDHVKVYTENVPENVNAINSAVARQLAPMAQAFSGVLVDCESDASRGDDLTSRVRTDNGVVAGNCGNFGFCCALAPLACYTCRYFQPWLDGPHEEILNQLECENRRIMQITGDSRVAAANDRTMLAIAEVVRLCRLRRQS